MDSLKKSSILSICETEKTKMLANLVNLESNACIRKCKRVKMTYVVSFAANKIVIKRDVVALYKLMGIAVNVDKVNVLVRKPKKKGKKTRNARAGFSSGSKRAIVTFKEGCAPPVS